MRSRPNSHIVQRVARRRRNILTTLKDNIPPKARILVALSGGKDSSALLHGLLRVRRLLGLHLEACHIDHGLRPESGNDAEVVARHCAELGVRCHVVKLGEKPKRANMEAWGRQERYRVFAEVMESAQLSLLVTAHTANDVAETLLMRLFANKELTTIEEQDPQRKCLRPLLTISRQQVEEFVERHNIPFVEDPSNRDTTMVRNRVRQRVLPLLEREFDPSMVWTLSERARSIAADCQALQQVAAEIAERVGAVEWRSQAWLQRCQREVSRAPYAVAWRVVQALFVPVLGHTVGEARARAILQIISGDASVLDLGEQVIEVEPDGSGLKLRS